MYNLLSRCCLILTEWASFSNIVVFLLSLGIILGAVQHDQTVPYKGWEIPKVSFWMFYGSALLGLLLMYQLAQLVRLKKFSFPKVATRFHMLVALIFLLLIISTVLSDWSRTVQVDQISNQFYFFVLKILQSLGIVRGNTMSVSTSIIGNEFREQGLIFYSILLGLFLLIRKHVSSENGHILFLGFIISAVIQSLKAFDQYFYLHDHYPHLLEQHVWIYGYFGQANFFAGHIFLGLFLSIYFLFNIQSRIRYIFILPAFLILTALVLSNSTWIYVVILVGSALIIVKSILTNKQFLVFFGYALLLFTIILLPTLLLIHRSNSVYEHRITIWRDTFDVYVTRPLHGENEIENLFFGSGFDTIGNEFAIHEKMPGQLVDRTHNIFLDILAQHGIVLLCIIFASIIMVFWKVKFKLEDPMIFYTFLCLLLLLLRNSIHTCSAVNLVDLFIFTTVATAFLSHSSNSTLSRKKVHAVSSAI